MKKIFEKVRIDDKPFVVLELKKEYALQAKPQQQQLLSSSQSKPVKTLDK